jgi:hypothetical protein
MARLDEIRQQYADLLLKGMKQAEAYRIINPKCATWKQASIDNKASAMARHPAVLAKMQASREAVTKEVHKVMAYGLIDAMAEAERALNLAERTGQSGSMVAAVQLRAKLNGLITEKKEVSVTQMGNMTPSDKMALLDAANAALAQLSQVKLIDNTVDDVEAKV